MNFEKSSTRLHPSQLHGEQTYKRYRHYLGCYRFESKMKKIFFVCTLFGTVGELRRTGRVRTRRHGGLYGGRRQSYVRFLVLDRFLFISDTVYLVTKHIRDSLFFRAAENVSSGALRFCIGIACPMRRVIYGHVFYIHYIIIYMGIDNCFITFCKNPLTVLSVSSFLRI